MYQIPRSEIRLLWETNHWDGVLSGYAEWKGTLYYFTLQDQNSDREGLWYRRYDVIPLTEKEKEQARKAHAAFQKYVGTHCDLDELGERKGEVRPKVEWSKFYDNPAYRVPEPTGVSVGWFEL